MTAESPVGDQFPQGHPYPAETQGSPGFFVISRLIKSAANTLLDLVFPPSCAGCGRVDYRWCPRCVALLAAVPVELLPRTLPTLVGCAATGIHAGKLQAAIHALKYDFVRDLAPLLAARLFTCLAESNWTIDMIIPVPLHTTRLAERGYNQSQLLGEYLADQWEVPCLPQGLQRHRQTRQQVGLNHVERLANVDGAFLADPTIVRDAFVLLIDDVCTTGATLEGCAHALLAEGARGVYALTVSMAN